MQEDAEAERCWEELMPYVEGKYFTDEVKRADKAYPYGLLYDIENPKLAYKELLMWFILEHKNPKTGKTPLEEYVYEKVEDKRLAKIMLEMGNIINGPFLVMGFEGNILQLEDMAGKSYNVEIKGLDSKQRKSYARTTLLEARLYPWLERYRFGSISLALAMTDK